MDAPRRSRTVFVTAARPEEAAITVGLLRRCGLDASSVFDLQVPYDPASGSSEQIGRAGGAVAAVRGAELPAGVIYELGVANGLGLPTLIVSLIGTDDDFPLLPGGLQGLHQVRWDPATEPDAALLARIRGLLTVPTTPTPAPGLPSGQRPHIPKRRYADASERRAAEVLAYVGAEIAAEGPGNQPGHPDLSAWFPDLPNWANPVIIEVKARDPSGGSHSGAVQQLRAYLHVLGLPIGIVLVPGERPPVWESEEGTAIMLLGVETLAELGPQGARDHLIRARNLIAHSA